MTLEFVKPKWKLGELPWYRLSIKNESRRTIQLHRFWFSQTAWLDHGEYFDFDVTGPGGKKLGRSGLWYGFHGENAVWDNAPSPDDLFLGPGESFTATPSVPSPKAPQLKAVPGYRVLEGFVFDEPGDYTIKAVYKHEIEPAHRGAEEELAALKAKFGSVSSQTERFIRERWKSTSLREAEAGRRTVEEMRTGNFYVESSPVTIRFEP